MTFSAIFPASHDTVIVGKTKRVLVSRGVLNEVAYLKSPFEITDRSENARPNPNFFTDHDLHGV